MVTEFTIGFSRTINLGNFESCRIEATITVEHDPDDKRSPEEIREDAQQKLRQLLEETYRAQFKSRQERAA